MAGLTLAQAEQRLADYLAAEQKVLEGQAYSLFGRMMTRANLGEIQKGIDIWQERVNKLARGGIRVRTGVPL